MIQLLRTASRSSAPPVLLLDTLASIRPLVGQLRVEAQPVDRDGWIDLAALGDPDSGPLGALNRRFVAGGFGANKKATAASLMLRYGWASGFTVAAYLACSRVPVLDDFALKFSSMTLIEALWVKEVRFMGLSSDPMAGCAGWGASIAPDALRAEVLASLIAFTKPLIERQHEWSGFSRHALWSMAVSSWAGQFTSVGELLGDRALGLSEAQAVLGLDPQIAKATPDLYEVTDGVTTRVCQNRAACCLYFKGPRRHFCASCPIIPEAERLDRNMDWVKTHTRERQATESREARAD